MPHRFRLGLLLGAVALTLAVGLLVKGFSGHSSPEDEPTPPDRNHDDPRQSYRGPFLNTHPDVRYVGMETCGECHAGIAQTYAQHGMARALQPVKVLARSQVYDAGHHNPFHAFGSLFKVDREGTRVWHRETRLDERKQPIYQLDLEAVFAVGSGKHGHSYLAVLGDGYLFQTPISWFAQKNIWDLSPGFTAKLKRRPVRQDCLFCHANRAFPREGYANRYELPVISECAIGCERCHGPGALHVKDPGLKPVPAEAVGYVRDEVDRADFTIVNPGKLKAELRASVCQQCHLEGEARVLRRGRGLYDFRPGLPLKEFWSIFVHARDTGEDKKAVNHVEQMYLSRCFQRSREPHKLGCTSCHNPHQAVAAAKRPEYYRQRCLECHAGRDAANDKSAAFKQRPCTLAPAERRLRNQDNCVFCHMPPYASSDIVHAASTDHRIIRRLEKPLGDGRGSSRDVPLVHFHRGRVDARDKELARDLGIALVIAALLGKEDARVLRPAVELLEKALHDFPDDLVSWQIKTVALSLEKRFSESLAAAQAVLARAPNDETTLAVAAVSAQTLGKLDAALDYWKRAVTANPWRGYYRQNLATLLAASQAWPDATTQSRAWLRLDPANIDARKMYIECLLRIGNLREAGAEFARLEALRPENLEALKAWFRAETRR